MSPTPPPPANNPFEVVDTRAGYDRWAEIYDDEGNPLLALEEPLVAELLGDVRNLRIADIGCGTGRHAVQLAANGALVTAVDFSDGMLARATGKSGSDKIRFVQHDLTRPLPFSAAEFDRVLCCLVLDHIHDVDALFGELGRVCRPDGFIVISVMHPAMMLRGVQARFTDPATGRETRPASAPNQISDYVMAAAASKLKIDHMSEHAVDEALAARMERARKHLSWPMLLMLRLRP